jgi:hypothetical protein
MMEAFAIGFWPAWTVATGYFPGDGDDDGEYSAIDPSNRKRQVNELAKLEAQCAELQ